MKFKERKNEGRKKELEKEREIEKKGIKDIEREKGRE